MSTCARPNCPNSAQPGKNRGMCEKHYNLDPERGYVDPGPSRERIELLRSRGVTIAMMNQHGLSKFGVRRVQTAERIRKATEAKVFSIPVPESLVRTRAHVDAIGTTRRIQALVALGWTQGQIAAELGTKQTAVSAIALRGKVTAETAIAVKELFERWSMTLGPSSLTRLRAIAKGWAPPLAWDELDDPGEKPNLGSRRRVPFPERYRELRAMSLSDEMIARRMGIDPESLERQLMRHGLYERRSA
ncbi:hypothetical protein [Mycobacterium dioxanotrophicus]|nr:hypothetical protein [Mycobacterium dioxanotrophicus]